MKLNRFWQIIGHFVTWLKTSWIEIKMGKKNFKGPKRASYRQFNGLNRNGGSGDTTVFTADEAITLQKTIIDIDINSETVSGAVQDWAIEIWRKRVNVALPTVSLATLNGGVPYGLNSDLLYRRQGSIMREVTSAGAFFNLNKILKGMRKLKSGQQIVIRVVGGSFLIFNGTVVLFLLES